MCKGKRTYIPVELGRYAYKIYMDDLKSISKMIKKKTPRLPSFDTNCPKAEQYTDEEMTF